MVALRCCHSRVICEQTEAPSGKAICPRSLTPGMGARAMMLQTLSGSGDFDNCSVPGLGWRWWANTERLKAWPLPFQSSKFRAPHSPGHGHCWGTGFSWAAGRHRSGQLAPGLLPKRLGMELLVPARAWARPSALTEMPAATHQGAVGGGVGCRDGRQRG